MNFDEKYIEIIRNFHAVKQPLEAIELYNLNSDFFKEYGGKFIFSTDKNIAGLPFTNLFSEYKDYCRSAFRTYNFIFYSQEIKKAYKTSNTVQIPIESSISYDSNFAKFVENYMKEKNSTKGKDYEAGEKILWQLVMGNDISHDYFPYILENIYKENVPLERVIDNVEVIIKLFHIDKDSASKIYKMKVRNEEKYISDCEEAKEFIKNASSNDEIKRDILGTYDIFYLILLKIIWINKTIRPDKQKAEALYEFMDKELAALSQRELFIGLEYFSNNNLKFFKRIKGDNYGNIIEAVKNMSWDLILCRMFEKSYTVKISERSDFFLPFFLTFDKGLREILDAYRMKCLIFFEKKYPMQPIIDLSDKNELIKYINETYYTYNSILNRQTRSNMLIDDNFNSYIKTKIKQSENEIGNILPI